MEHSFISNFIVSVSPLAEMLLETIATDYNLPVDELKKRYLYQNKKVYNKILKKHKTKKTRKIHAYNIFLSDKKEIDKLLKQNNTENQTEINRQKGELWEKYKDTSEIYNKYDNIAKLENKGLLTKKYRKQILTNYDKYDETLNDILENDDEDFTLTESLKLLNLN